MLCLIFFCAIPGGINGILGRLPEFTLPQLPEGFRPSRASRYISRHLSAARPANSPLYFHVLEGTSGVGLSPNPGPSPLVLPHRLSQVQISNAENSRRKCEIGMTFDGKDCAFMKALCTASIVVSIASWSYQSINHIHCRIAIASLTVSSGPADRPPLRRSTWMRTPESLGAHEGSCVFLCARNTF